MASQSLGVKALWMERRLSRVGSGGWEVGWGVCLSSTSFLLNLPNLQSIQQPSSPRGLGLRRPLGSTRNRWGRGRADGAGEGKIGPASSPLPPEPGDWKGGLELRPSFLAPYSHGS